MSHKNSPKEEVKPEGVPQPEAPKFILSAKDVKTGVGKKTKFTYKAQGVPMPELKWLKDDREVIPAIEGITIANHCETTLTIFNAQPEHGGTYTCQATNSAGAPVEKKVSLKVTKKDVKPEEEKKAPQLKAPTLWALKKLVKTGVGETATLTCKAKGVPMPELKWLKNDTEVTPATEGITISPTVDGETTLTITNAQPEHGGTYTCQATNSDGAQVETIVKFIVCEVCAFIRNNLGRKPMTVLLQSELDEIEACEPELLQAINALMNGKGGYVLIHTTDPGYLDEFDQKVDNVLKTLTPYESFYDEYFRRYITDDAQHVVFEVLPQAGDRLPYILHFHSKVSLNRGLADLTQGQLLTVVKRTLKAQNSKESDTALETPKRDKFMSNLVQETPIMDNNVPFVENFSMQAKGTKDNNSVIVKKIKDSDSLVGELWSGNLKLVHYISAFSKLPDGGSLYFGVKEDKPKRRFFCIGFEFEEKQGAEIEEAISKRIKKNMLWVGTRAPKNLVTVKLHLVRQKASSEQQQDQPQPPATVSPPDGEEEIMNQDQPQPQATVSPSDGVEEKMNQDQPQPQATVSPSDGVEEIINQDQPQPQATVSPPDGVGEIMNQDQPQPQATVSPPDAVTHGQRGSDDPAEGQPSLNILDIKTGHNAQGLLFHKKEGPDISNICSICKKSKEEIMNQDQPQPQATVSPPDAVGEIMNQDQPQPQATVSPPDGVEEILNQDQPQPQSTVSPSDGVEEIINQDQPQPQATVSPPDAVTHGQRGSDDPAEGQPPLYILEIKTGHYAQGLLFHKKEGPDIYNICSICKKPYAVDPEVWVRIYDRSGKIKSTPKPKLRPQCP